MTTRTLITATPLYPGSFVPENGHPVVVSDASPDTVLAVVTDDEEWFALEVCTMIQKRWTDGEDGEMWRLDPATKPVKYRIYVGESPSTAPPLSGHRHNPRRREMRAR